MNQVLSEIKRLLETYSPLRKLKLNGYSTIQIIIKKNTNNELVVDVKFVE